METDRYDSDADSVCFGFSSCLSQECLVPNMIHARFFMKRLNIPEEFNDTVFISVSQSKAFEKIVCVLKFLLQSFYEKVYFCYAVMLFSN